MGSFTRFITTTFLNVSIKIAFETTKTIHKRTEYRTGKPNNFHNIRKIKCFVIPLTYIQDEKVYRLTCDTKSIFSLCDSKEMPVNTPSV
jgi:hypothetical protein